MLNVLHIMISSLVARLRRDEAGEVSIEYVLVGGMAAIAIIAGMAVLMPAAGGWFTNIADRLTTALP